MRGLKNGGIELVLSHPYRQDQAIEWAPEQMFVDEKLFFLRRESMNRIVKTKEPIDGQITALAGEFFVAAELLKHGLQTSVTFGNAKQIDLLAHYSRTGRNFNVQVKALRGKNTFPIAPAKVNRRYIYVFVLLNNPGESVQYFIVPGSKLADEPIHFGKYFKDTCKIPCIDLTSLAAFENCWECFLDPGNHAPTGLKERDNLGHPSELAKG